MFTVGEGLISRAEFLNNITQFVDDKWIVNNNKNIGYYNIPASFDIEVSSFYENGEKRAVMYIWQFGIWNYVTTGRTWEEFIAFISVLKNIMFLSDKLRLIVYVHNLPYEFQFIRKRLKWEEVFLLDDRKPVYANSHGIEFRCSLKLAGGKSLANVSEDLQKYKCEKMVGDLDYKVIRSPLTVLTDKELKYCENDIRVVNCYIQEKIEQDGDITRIPLTNTGYVRNYCRKACFSRWKPYHNLMQELTITPDEYRQLKRAFQGGFTHANAHHVNQVLKNVGSHDFTSSYPAVMVLEKFPMSQAISVKGTINEEQLTELLLNYCCLFELEIWNIIPKLNQEHPISRSKCYICEGEVADNGRIVTASHIKLTVTEQDYFIYSEFYEWEEVAISDFRYYEKGYLPKVFVEPVLELYIKKQMLKDVIGEEVNYMISKNMVNSAFGMMVTDPVRDIIEYVDDLYNVTPGDVEEAIEKYNKNIRRFLYYPWGVWVTAYARANLFSGIIALGDDYIYSDTDSVKSLNTEKHQLYFDTYNYETIEKIKESSAYFNIPLDKYSPLNLTIGVWDDEGIFDKFKTLGAKRYMTYRKKVKKGKKNYVLTLAGANKMKSMKYLQSTGDPFGKFEDSLIIPKEFSGRGIITYIDEPIEGDMVDCQGNVFHYRELSCAHLEDSEYSLSQSEEFKKYLEGVVDYGE